MRGVYIHIPFCKNICSYCDFCKMYVNTKYIDKYLVSLDKEIRNRYKGDKVKSIYIGGGTPSAIGIDNLVKLFDIIKMFNKDKDIEITIECNPEDINPDMVKLFKENNVNRVSLGVQSFDDNIIKELNRSHTKDMVIRALRVLRKGGIDNINIDLMYGVSNDINIIKEDLDTFIKLSIPHISYYSLILEENTKMHINNKQYIDENTEVEMYNYIRNFLKTKGYNQYEISNYSKEGYESVHNKIYWQNDSYYGFGLGAVSFYDDKRIINTKSITKYFQNDYIYDIIKEDLLVRMNTEISLGFRMLKGISKKRFRDKYNRDIDDVYDMGDLIKEGVLIDNGDYICINSDYLYVSNEVIVRVLNSIKELKSIKES